MSGTPSVRPLGDRSRVAIAALGLVGVAALLSIWADLDQLSLLDRLGNAERVTLAEAQASDDRAGTVGLIYIVATVLAAIAFLIWYGQAYRNVIAMGMMNPRFGTRWALWYWLIPIANLFRPKQVMNDIWRGSDPALPKRAVAWQQGSIHPLLNWWWAAWIISAFAARYAISRAYHGANDFQGLHDRAVAYVVSDICDAVACALAIAVVLLVTRRHEERRARYESGALDPELTAEAPSPPSVPPPPQGLPVG